MVSERWKLLPKAPLTFLAALSDLPPLLAQLLFHRLTSVAPDPEAARAFLDPNLMITGDPFLLPDMEAAVMRLREAIRNDELIAIYGDYDVDGISGTYLLEAGLSPEAAIAAGSWTARRFLGLPLIEEGAPADLVVLPSDPRADVSVLARPSLIMLDGSVISSRP